MSDPDAADWIWTHQGPFDRQPFREGLAAWCAQAEELLGELGEFSSACRLIERRFFSGHPVLYPQAAETLENLRETVAGLADMVNAHYVAEWDSLGHSGDQPTDGSTPFRLEPVEAARIMETADGSRTVHYLVAVAKAEAFEKLGEREKAEAVLEPHLRAAP